MGTTTGAGFAGETGTGRGVDCGAGVASGGGADRSVEACFCNSGAAGGTAATVENLVYLKSLIPQDSTWSALGIGSGHLPILFATLALGGHIRVGMEDNVYYAKNRLAKSNAEFVERAARLIREANKEVASPADARAILNLKR